MDEVAITMGRRLWVSICKLSPILGTIFAAHSGTETGVCLDIDLLIYVAGLRVFERDGKSVMKCASL